MRKDINLKEKQIIRLYAIDKVSIIKIAKMFGCDSSTIQARLLKNNVSLFPQGYFIRGKAPPNKKVLDEEEVVRLYVEERKSKMVIAKMFNCDENVIRRILCERKIPTYPLGFHHTIRKKHNRLNIDEEEVIDLYLIEKISPSIIAKKYNCDTSTIWRILKRNNVSIHPKGFFTLGRKPWNTGLTTETDERLKESGMKRRGHPCYKDPVRNKKISDANVGKPSWNKDIFGEEYLKHFENGQSWNKGKTHFDDDRILYGEKNHLWAGGISFEPYGKDFNIKLKKEVRKRDNHTCQLCGIGQEETYRKLDVHHVDYNKTNNTIYNLIALCFKCHLKTNLNRPHWQSFFQKLLYKKYGYKYAIKMEVKMFGRS